MLKPRSAFALVMLLAVILVVTMSVGALVLGLLYYEAIEAHFPELMAGAAGSNWADRGFLILMLAIGIPVGVLLSWTLARRMSAPMTEVARAIRAVAAGDLTARAAPSPDVYSEMKGLAEDFNRLADRLERSEAEMHFANAAIAHELRTPLTILKGRLQGVSDGVFEITPEMISMLLAQVDGLTRIVEDLRLLSLLEPGRVPLNKQAVDLGDLVQQTIGLVADDLQEAGIETRLSIAPAVVEADSARLRQAFLALLTNAMKYAPGGPLHISVRQNEAQAFIVVTDGGPGMPSEGLTQAFDPFWRGEKSRGRDKGGSGLGLAVVRAIITAHGGSVAVCNPAGGGCKFTVCLPKSSVTSAKAVTSIGAQS
ncbi:MAG: HAMP domain-containing protein [Asticcacaulis sp.]|jgi:two-component system sensor histidine kinase AdeS|uniref:ATP-binding protein n=1 Tax=Asticcacaulis sp. TaxID=1872648 RepID=UPI0025C3A7B0|nr:ATP-binding protein [Asticcacaulis sp.]MCA1936518.1 HAMP domain-containing protein [Asticcacaulis sp.]